jgi:hypothetical protein
MSRSTHSRERRALQCAIALAACVPISAGLAGMLRGAAAFEPDAIITHAADAALDSHVRYLSGLLFGLGISFLAMIPRIEHRATPVRMLTFMVAIGGLARLAAALIIATPSLPMQLAIGMELLVTPLLCLWQARIAAAYRSH